MSVKVLEEEKFIWRINSVLQKTMYSLTVNGLEDPAGGIRVLGSCAVVALGWTFMNLLVLRFDTTGAHTYLTLIRCLSDTDLMPI